MGFSTNNIQGLSWFMNLQKRLEYNKNKILLYLVLSIFLGFLSIGVPIFINFSGHAASKLAIFTTVMTLPFNAFFSCISAASFVYLLERFPRFQVVTVSLFVISYFEDFLDFELVKIISPFVTLMSIIIFWRLKTTNISVVIFLLFFSCSTINTIITSKSLYDSPIFYLPKSHDYVEEKMDKIVYQSPRSHLDKIRQAHRNLPDSYKLLDASVRVVQPGTIDSWIIQNIGESHPSISGWAAYSLWGRNKVLLEIIDDELLLDKILIHELTHVKQYDRYGVLACTKPVWKIEGEAALVENFSPNDEIKNFLVKEKYFLPFKYWYFDFSNDDYKASQAQAWYYLKCLGISEDEFFDSRTKLAAWEEVKKAFLEFSDA